MIAFDEREQEIVRFALAYLAANIEDFFDDWPTYFDDTVMGDLPLLRANVPSDGEVVELLKQVTAKS